MMAGSRCSFRLSLITARFLHFSRIPQRKHYNYDLDSLIKWKEETAQIFGSIRKPTKTGKLKKTKKGLDHHIEENLQTLSAISSSKESSTDTPSNSAVKKGNKTSMTCAMDKMTTTDDIHLSCLPFSDSTCAHVQANKEKNVKYIEDLKCPIEDIPDNVLIHSMMPYGAETTLEQSYNADSDNEGDSSTNYDRESNDDIVIPKISPIPASTSVTFGQNLKKCNENPVIRTGAEVTCDNVSEQAADHCDEIVNTGNSGDVITLNNISTFHPVEPVLTKTKSGKNSNSTKRASSKTKERFSTLNSGVTFEGKELAGTDIFIPILKPMPIGNISNASSNFPLSQPEISKVPSLPSSMANTINNLPYEPPESFQIISKIPLFPMECQNWKRSIHSDLLDAFKMDVEQMSLRALPSVKSILNKTMSDLNRFFLNRWREGLIKELGEEGFKKQQDATIRNGVNLHANIMEHLSGKPFSELQIMPENEGHWSSLQSALAAVGDVRALEVEISHSTLLYRGVFDCLARYKDLLCMIDWKTSKKPRPLLKNTYDDPVQVAAYIGALNASDSYVEKYGQVSQGVIVVAYSDGSPAHIHVMNKSVCEKHWQDWTERLYNYYQLTYTEKMATNAEKIDAKSQMAKI